MREALLVLESRGDVLDPEPVQLCLQRLQHTDTAVSLRTNTRAHTHKHTHIHTGPETLFAAPANTRQWSVNKHAHTHTTHTYVTSYHMTLVTSARSQMKHSVHTRARRRTRIAHVRSQAHTLIFVCMHSHSHSHSHTHTHTHTHTHRCNVPWIDTQRKERRLYGPRIIDSEEISWFTVDLNF